MVEHSQRICCLSVFDHFVKLALKGLRQKYSYVCIYAHIDINKIYKNKKAGQQLHLNKEN